MIHIGFLRVLPGSGISRFNNSGLQHPSQKINIDRITSPRANYNYTINTGNAYTPTSYDSRLACTAYNSNMGNSEQYPKWKSNGMFSIGRNYL